MNISSRCEYACRAVAELARHYPCEVPLTVTDLAERRDIPGNYLVHILLRLKRRGIVRSVRGAQGGYLLGRTPEMVSLYEVIAAVDGPLLEPLPNGGLGSRDLAPAFRDAAREIKEILGNVSIRSIVDNAELGSMYYI